MSILKCTANIFYHNRYNERGLAPTYIKINVPSTSPAALFTNTSPAALFTSTSPAALFTSTSPAALFTSTSPAALFTNIKKAYKRMKDEIFYT
jgi:hypothetical protein